MFKILVLISAVAVIGAISATLTERKRRLHAKKIVEKFERDNPKKKL